MNSITNNRALLVGVGADLPSTVTDAEGLAKILTDPSRCQYPPANFAVLTEGNAARDRVLAALDALATPAVADATVLIYYSGHGYRVTSSVGENYYLIHHSTGSPDRRMGRAQRNPSLNGQQIVGWVERSETHHSIGS